MPYSKKEKKLMRRLIKQYGAKKAMQIYHSMKNSGKHTNVFDK